MATVHRHFFHAASSLESYVKSLSLSRTPRKILGGCLKVASIPFHVMASLADTILGIGTGMCALVMAKKREKLCDYAIDHLNSSRELFACPFYCFLNNKSHTNPNFPFDEEVLLCGGNGLITHYFFSKIDEIAEHHLLSKKSLRKYVYSRLSYLLLAVTCLLTRWIDGCISLVALPLALLTLGKVATINIIAYRALQFTGIAQDIFYCLFKFVYPNSYLVISTDDI